MIHTTMKIDTDSGMRKKQETPRLVSFGYGFSTLLPTCSAISDNFATAKSFTSIKDCECVKETFHVPKPLTPSIGTSAAWEGRRELSAQGAWREKILKSCFQLI